MDLYLLVRDSVAVASHCADRDPTYFEYILSYLREKDAVELPGSEAEQEFLKEVEFYKLEGLLKLLEFRRSEERIKSVGEENVCSTTTVGLSLIPFVSSE